MAEQVFSYSVLKSLPPQLGLIVLQSDVTLEDDLRALLPASVSLRVSRVPSATTVSTETLSQMERHLKAAASLLPRGVNFDVIGYGCTSGTAQIGATRVAECIREGTEAKAVTEPVSALLAACKALQINRIALLSPYVESVSRQLRKTLGDQGIKTPVFGSFAEEEEAKVARIDAASIKNAALRLMAAKDVDALFLSCTNLRTLDVIPQLQRKLGVPVLSSNLVLGWHLLISAGAIPPEVLPGDLL